MSEEDLEYGFKHHHSGVMPTFVQFETETRCNANCRMCPKSKMKRRGKATWTTLIEVIEEILPHATETCPFLMQEPLLEPRLIPILNNIRYTTPSVKVTIYTNMAAMTEELARKILETRAVSKICVSFYGPTEEIYRRWQPPLDWHKTKENIKRFIRLRDELGFNKPRVELHVIAAWELYNAETIPIYQEEWLGVVDQISCVYYDTFCGRMPDLSDPEFRFSDHVEPKERAPCARLWGGLNILSSGDVVPCCLDYEGEYPMGNINKTHVKKIWRGEKFNEFRRLHLERRFDEMPLCRDCIVWKTPSDHKWQQKWEAHLK